MPERTNVRDGIEIRCATNSPLKIGAVLTEPQRLQIATAPKKRLEYSGECH